MADRARAVGPLRRSLEALYLGSGLLSGCFLAAIALAIIAQIGGRFVGLAIDGTELAGFCMAASTFLGLAYTLKNGTHVRVTLAIRGAPPTLRRAIEAMCCLIGLAASLYFTTFAVKLVLQSYRFGDVSPGLIAAPFWIPQLAMAFGGALIAIAFLDELTLVLTGREAGYESGEGVLDGEPIEAPGSLQAPTEPR